MNIKISLALSSILKTFNNKFSISTLKVKRLLISLFIIHCLFLWNNPLCANILSDSLPSDSARSVPISQDAITSAVKYDASDSIKIDNPNEMIYLYGNAEVHYEEITLKAPFIQINMKSNELTAFGQTDSLGNFIKADFSDGTQNYASKKIAYNFNTKKGKINQVITSQGEGFLHGEQVKMNGDNDFYVKNGKYTTCSAEQPHFHMQASKLKVMPNNKIITGPAYLVLNDIPTPLVLPFVLFPNKNEKHASGLIIPSFANGVNGLGLIGGGYYWSISDKMSTELTGDIYSLGSWGAHNNTAYNRRYKFNGSIGLDYVRTKRGDKEIVTEYTEKSDFKVRWVHRQDSKARPNGTFSSNVNFYSSSFNQTDVNAQMSNERISASSNSGISYNYRFPRSPFSATVSAKHTQNNTNGNIDVSLPEFNLSMQRLYLRNENNIIGKPKWYQNFSLAYTARAISKVSTNDSLLGEISLAEFQEDIKSGMKHSIPIQGMIKTKYFNITPRANFNSHWYFDYETIDSTHQEGVRQNGFKTGNDFNLGMTFNTVFYGDYIPIGKRKHIEKIRHVITPSIGFTYMPDFTSNYWSDFSGYQQAYDTTLMENQLYHLFDANQVMGKPSRGKTGAISFNIGNTLQMKVKTPNDSISPTKKVSVFDRLNIGTSYNIFADSLNLSTVRINGNTTVLKKLRLSFSSVLDPYQLGIDNQKINKFVWSEKGQLLRMTQSNMGVSWSFQGKADRQNQGVMLNNIFSRDYLYFLDHPEMYIDFNIPWSLNLSYNINYRKTYTGSTEVLNFTQTLNFTGDVRVSENWKVGYSSGYDFINKDITTNTRFSLNRDLHCWEMSLVWSPFGRTANYLFTIAAKSSMLQDLKVNRRKTNNEYGEL